MRKAVFSLAALTAFAAISFAAEIHVAVGGKDANPGTAAAPFRTIQRAAEAAQPGDIVTVHAGVYRERVNPPRGGASDARRIVFRAAPGERVEIKGSEPVTGWRKVQNDTWQARVPASVLRRIQSLRRPDPRRLVRAQGPTAPHRRGLSRRRMAGRGRDPGRGPEASRRNPRCGSRGSRPRRRRSGPSSRGLIPTPGWSRSMSAGPSSIPRKRASTT